jgi:nucleotide-binding universal stress UspA family protein
MAIFFPCGEGGRYHSLFAAMSMMRLNLNQAHPDQALAVRSILHPTDLSAVSGLAFAHALAISLAAKSKLHLLHVSPYDATAIATFPSVRPILAQWGASKDDDAPWAIASNLGIEVYNTHIKRQEPVQGILGYLQRVSCDLMVLATHGGDGFHHWLRGSVSETASRHSLIPTLFITSGARGFADPITGDVSIRRILVPIDFSPNPGEAINTVDRILKLLTKGAHFILHLLHVGRRAPSVRLTTMGGFSSPQVILRSGIVPMTIVDAAIEFDVDLIVMPTAGRHGIFDAVRGSTTERVIRHAPCPVFAIPSQ